MGDIVTWRDSLLESSLSYRAKYMGLILSQYYRPNSATYPAIRTLVQVSGLTINPVQDGIAELEENGYIIRKQERLKGNKYLSNIYSFSGVTENGHVSPDDTSNDTPNEVSNEVSADTSNEVSPGDTEIALYRINTLCGEAPTHNLKIFNLKEEKSEWYQEAKNLMPNLSDTIIQISYEKFTETRKNQNKPLTLSDWKVWIYQQKDISHEAPPIPIPSLSEEMAIIQKLGATKWKKRRKMAIDSNAEKFLTEWEARNGEVWWNTIVEYEARQHVIQ